MRSYGRAWRCSNSSRDDDVENPPVIPEDTCAYIDMVIEITAKMAACDDAAWRRNQQELARALLEHVRDSNLKLRQLGIYWYERHKRQRRIKKGS